MINELLENPEVLFSFSVVQICLRNFLDEFIDRSLSHKFEPLLSSVVIVEPSFLNFLFLILPHFLLFVLSTPR